MLLSLYIIAAYICNNNNLPEVATIDNSHRVNACINAEAAEQNKKMDCALRAKHK